MAGRIAVVTGANGGLGLATAAHPGLTDSDLQSTTAEHGGGGFLGHFFHTLTVRTGMSIEHTGAPSSG